MNRDDALQHVRYFADDAGDAGHFPRAHAPFQSQVNAVPDRARLVCYVTLGSDPLVIAVWSYLGGRLPDAEAEELAYDHLSEMDYFDGEPREADYIL